MAINDFDWNNFYEFYKEIEDNKIKKLLRKNMAYKCRVTGKTIRNWISLKTIPFTQSNRVTKAVNEIAPLLDINEFTITEKILFPIYALEIESYANFTISHGD